MNTLVSGLFSTAESYGKTDAVFEIILMLVVAFLLGYLLRFFLDRRRTEDKYREPYLNKKHEYDLLVEKLKTFEAENNRLRADLEACMGKKSTQSAPVSTVSKTQKDDLKKVKGIGPKIEKLLNERGIYTFVALSETRLEILQDVLDKAGPNFQFHNPATWPRQARLAAEGKWDELKKWQEEL